MTGLRREDLARVTWASVGEFVIVKKAMKSSRCRRHFATVPRIARLDAVLEILEGRSRASDIDTVLVNL